jgi:hypothetical protein
VELNSPDAAAAELLDRVWLRGEKESRAFHV